MQQRESPSISNAFENLDLKMLLIEKAVTKKMNVFQLFDN